MYTLGTLQEKLEEAKSSLRVVESSIFKADGKSAFNSGARYYAKQNARQDRPPDDGGPPRRRVFDLLGDYNTTGRKRVVEESTQRRRVSIDEDLPDRRVAKRPVSDQEDGEADDSPVRKKAFHSVVGRAQLSDLSVTLQRGRRERDRQPQQQGNTRSVFARLSGIAQNQHPQYDEGDEEDEEIIQKRQPVVPSRVLAVEHPTPSREEVITAEKQDVARQQRDRRIFGALMGTLKQFRREETQVKEKEERRLKIEKKLEDEAVREKERMKEEKQSLQVERRRREADIKRIEWSMNRVKEFAAWEACVLQQRNFIKTKSKPELFYLPKAHCPASEALLEESSKLIQEEIDSRLASLNSEIESSEKKALRAAGELVDDLDKENDDQEPRKEQKQVDDGDVDEDEGEETWEESQYEGLQLVEGPDIADDTKPVENENSGSNVNGAQNQVAPDVEMKEKSPDSLAAEDKPELFPTVSEANFEKADEITTANTLPAQSPVIHKSPSPSKQANDENSQMRSSPEKKVKDNSKSKSRSPVKSSDKRSSRERRKSRSPDKRTSSRSGRNRSPIRRPRRSRSRSPRRSARSRSAQRRRPRRSRSPDRRRRSRSNRRSPRRRPQRRDTRRSRSASPRRRKRSRSSSTSSSSSSSSSSSGSHSDRKKLEMRVPHTIDRNTLLAYGPSIEARDAPGEADRTIRAEDQSWDEGHVPSLAHLCCNNLPAVLLPVLPCHIRDYMLETLPIDLPLPLATKVIQDGIYWKRRTSEKWKTVSNVLDAGGSWKRFFMEKYTQEFVERLVPTSYSVERIEELCALVSDFVYRLNIRELQVEERFIDPDMNDADLGEACDRINLLPLVSGLENLVELHIQFTVRNVGSNYRKVLLEFTIQDCKNLGRGIAVAQNLRLLRIHQSSLDDAKLASLLTAMRGNESLEALAFPHCRLGDEGAAALAKFLEGRPKLRKLDVSNNFIGPTGVQALAFVLTQENGCSLMELNLSLNGFGDSGAKFLLSALQRKAPALRSLNISCSGLGEDSGMLVGEVFSRNSCLVDVNVSNNAFSEEAGNAIIKGFLNNTSLQFLDLRMTNVSDDVQQQLEGLLHANRCRDRQ